MRDQPTLALLAAVDEAFYVQTYPDVLDSQYPPSKHFLFQGWRELRQPNEWFDMTWYVEQNPSVQEQGLNPLQHYLAWGWREGRSPHPSRAVQDAVLAAGRRHPGVCPILILVADKAARLEA